MDVIEDVWILKMEYEIGCIIYFSNIVVEVMNLFLLMVKFGCGLMELNS